MNVSAAGFTADNLGGSKYFEAIVHHEILGRRSEISDGEPIFTKNNDNSIKPKMMATIFTNNNDNSINLPKIITISG